MKKGLTLLLLFCGLFYEAQSVPVKLRNNSLKSIPLIIPGVMNPNLSPFSSSGADLEAGQKIYANINGQEVLLITISQQDMNRKFIINRLIKEEKKKQKKFGRK